VVHAKGRFLSSGEGNCSFFPFVPFLNPMNKGRGRDQGLRTAVFLYAVYTGKKHPFSQMFMQIIEDIF